MVKYQTKLAKEEQRHNQLLSGLIAEKSKLFIPPGSTARDILHAKSADIAQNRLTYYIASAGSKLKEARTKLGDPRFLYSADILIAAEKERLSEVLGNVCNRSFQDASDELF